MHISSQWTEPFHWTHLTPPLVNLCERWSLPESLWQRLTAALLIYSKSDRDEALRSLVAAHPKLPLSDVQEMDLFENGSDWDARSRASNDAVTRNVIASDWWGCASASHVRDADRQQSISQLRGRIR
jgi:hypothetical protein